MKKFGFLTIMYGIIFLIAPCIQGTDFAQRYSLTSHIVNQPSYFDIRQERKKLRKPFRPFPSKNCPIKQEVINRKPIVKERSIQEQECKNQQKKEKKKIP